VLILASTKIVALHYYIFKLEDHSKEWSFCFQDILVLTTYNYSIIALAIIRQSTGDRPKVA